MLHVLDHLGAGGIQTYALNLFHHWSDPAFEHHIAALHGPGANHDRFVERGISPRYAATSRVSMAMPLGLKGIVREVEPDLVHVYGVPATLLCERLRSWLGISRLVTHLQSTYANHPGQRYQDLLERACYWRCDRIVACSQAVTHGLERLAPVTIIHNGIDLESFARSQSDRQRVAVRTRLGFGADDLVVGTSGRLVHGKDPWTLCEAFERLAAAQPSLRLLFVGGGPLQEELQQWLAVRGLKERAHITGFIPPGEVSSLLHAMDIFAFPSLREGSPLALAEAMACGLPCVCADFPAAAEVIEHERNGLIFRRQDADGLACAIRRLVDQPADRERLGAQARRTAEERLSARVMAERIAEVYRQLLGG